MEASLNEAQQAELASAKAFSELRGAKEAEKAAAETQLDAKEDALAQADMDNANAGEELERQQKVLAELQKFMKEVGENCEAAEANFAVRKQARLDEIQAVAETIQILMGDHARDAT